MGGLLTHVELQLVFYTVTFLMGMALKQPIVDWFKGVPKELRTGIAAAETAALKRMREEALKIAADLKAKVEPPKVV